MLRGGPGSTNRVRGVLALGVVAVVLSGCGTVDRDDLTSYVDQLHSDAAEAILLANQAQRGKVPVSFTWIESAELEHHAGELLDHLTREMAANGLRSRVAAAKAIAEQLKTALAEFHSQANDRAAVATVKQALAQQAAAAKSLLEELE